MRTWPPEGWKEVEEIFIMRIVSGHVTTETFCVAECQATQSIPERIVVRGPVFTMPKPEAKL
jgi:hypothetical protein